MLNITSDIVSKRAFYGDICRKFEKQGFNLCSGWEYTWAYFDSILTQSEGMTIYLRLPVHVIQGKLDNQDACLQFKQPFLIKHVVHTGFVEEDFKTLDLVGLNQFQTPLDPDDLIEHETKWLDAGVKAIDRIIQYVQ